MTPPPTSSRRPAGRLVICGVCRDRVAAAGRGCCADCWAAVRVERPRAGAR